MPLPRLVVLLLAASACTAPPAPPVDDVEETPAEAPVAAPRPLSVKDIVRRSMPAVVRIETDRTVGSGFVVAADGRIATNLHVIVGASDISVSLTDERKFVVDRVIAADLERDLVLLHVPASGLPGVRLGDSDRTSAGDRVVAIGNPLGVLDFTVSDGLVSSIRQEDGFKVIQTTAPISEGSSGGPLFNEDGEVIGIATFFMTSGQNLNFAIPSNDLAPLLLATGGETVAEFATRLRRRAEERLVPPRPTVPVHDVALLDDCTEEQLVRVELGISRAIELGAPVYNRGEHEACYVIYRAAAEGIVADESICQDVRDVLEAGLERASSAPDFTARAWAMRDAFDGLLLVMSKKSLHDR